MLCSVEPKSVDMHMAVTACDLHQVFVLVAEATALFQNAPPAPPLAPGGAPPPKVHMLLLRSNLGCATCILHFSYITWLAASDRLCRGSVCSIFLLLRTSDILLMSQLHSNAATAPCPLSPDTPQHALRPPYLLLFRLFVFACRAVRQLFHPHGPHLPDNCLPC